MPKQRIDWSTVTERQLEEFNVRTGPALKGALERVTAKVAQYYHDLTAASLVATYMHQGGRCVATGVKFKPAGLNAPRWMRLNRDLGDAPENLVLVSAGYYALRTTDKEWGDVGANKVKDWMAEVGAFAAARWEVSADPLRETLMFWDPLWEGEHADTQPFSQDSLEDAPETLEDAPESRGDGRPLDVDPDDTWGGTRPI